MINIDKQVVHWRKGAEEDWDVAVSLVQQGRIRMASSLRTLPLRRP
jgi:hypothetical protein